MSQELRGAYHRELDKLDIALATLIGLVPDAIADATEALLSDDPGLAASVARWRGLVDDLYGDIDGTVELVMARQAPVARDLRFLMCCVRVVPEVRDAIELVGWLAAPRPGGLAGRMSPRMRLLTSSLGGFTAAAWEAVYQLWRTRGVDYLDALRNRDDAHSDTHSSLVAEVVAGGMAVDAAVDMALVIAAYERLARHATAVARLVTPLVVVRPAESDAPR